MSFTNTPLTEKPTLRYVLARWGFDIGNKEHMHLNPLEDYIKKKGLKVYFNYRGLALKEAYGSDWGTKEEVNQKYFSLDSLPFGELKEVNEPLEIIDFMLDGEGVWVQSYPSDNYDLHPITPVKKQKDTKGYQIPCKSSDYFSLEDLLIKQSPYYFEFFDERLFLSVNNLKAFEQEYMYVDHKLTRKEIVDYLLLESSEIPNSRLDNLNSKRKAFFEKWLKSQDIKVVKQHKKETIWNALNAENSDLFPPLGSETITDFFGEICGFSFNPGRRKKQIEPLNK